MTMMLKRKRSESECCCPLDMPLLKSPKTLNLRPCSSTLADLIGKHKSSGLPESIVRRITRDILTALHLIHSHGFVYSALKPQNIVINNDDYSANLDFNFGLGGNKEEIKYLAPEAVCVDVLDSGRDIWALGCIVLEMLCGMDMWHDVGEDEIERFLIGIRKERGFLLLSDVISKDARAFLKACLGRYSGERLSAEELLDHPFVAAVEEEGLDELLLEFVPLDVWGLVQEADGGVEGGLEEPIEEELDFTPLEELLVDLLADLLHQEEEIVSVSGLDDYIPLEVEESSDDCFFDDFIPLEVEDLEEGSFRGSTTHS